MAFLAGVTGPVAATEPPVRAVVVIDLTKAGAQEKGRPVWLKAPVWVTDAPGPAQLIDLREKLETFAKDVSWDAEEAFLRALTSLPTAADPRRTLSHAGDQLLLILIADYSDEHVPVSVVKEVKRLTQLAQDLEKLVRTVISKATMPKGAKGVPTPPTIQLVEQTITLSERRANLTIGAHSVPTGKVPTTVSEDSCVNGGCVQRAAAITTGPVEKCFLSLDLPVTKVSDLVYDNASMTLQPRTTPTVVFLGFDVVPFGDVLTKPRSIGWSNLVVKGFIKLSSRPSDAFGFGLGLRPPELDLAGFKLDLFQVFGAYVWTKQDRLAEGGAADLRSSYKGALRAGVSFNLDKLADWLKL
jgi:hypothetical protein